MSKLTFNGVEYTPSALSSQDLFMKVLELAEERFPSMVEPLGTLGATALRDIISGHLPVPTPSDVKKMREQNFRISELSPAELRVLIYSQIGRIGLQPQIVIDGMDALYRRSISCVVKVVLPPDFSPK